MNYYMTSKSYQIIFANWNLSDLFALLISYIDRLLPPAKRHERSKLLVSYEFQKEWLPSFSLKGSCPACNLNQRQSSSPSSCSKLGVRVGWVSKITDIATNAEFAHNMACSFHQHHNVLVSVHIRIWFQLGFKLCQCNAIHINKNQVTSNGRRRMEKMWLLNKKQFPMKISCRPKPM